MSDPRSVRASPRRKRVSHRRYLVRRAAVVGIIVGAGFGVVRVAGALGGGDEPAEAVSGVVDITTTAPGTAPAVASTTTTDEPATLTGVTSAFADSAPDVTSDDSAPEDTDSKATLPGGSITSTAPTTTITVAPDTTPATTLPPAPTAEDPARVLVVGDSFAGLWGPPLQSTLDATGVVQTQIDYQMGTGLARPRNFDWFARVNEQLPAVAPDVVVTSFGGNDFVGLSTADGSLVVGDPVANEAEWMAEYEQRAGEMMDLLAADGRTVIWVGIPNDPDPARTQGLAIQNRAAKEAAASRPHVVFIDSWALFSGRDGNWAEYVIDPRDGQGKDVRMDDGYHINEAGAEIIAHYIAEAVRQAVHLPPG